jgi:hypothetical protein
MLPTIPKIVLIGKLVIGSSQNSIELNPTFIFCLIQSKLWVTVKSSMHMKMMEMHIIPTHYSLDNLMKDIEGDIALD